MDKNSVIGLTLIGAILIGFSIYNAPSDEQLAADKHKQDSIEAIKKLSIKEQQQSVITKAVEKINADTIVESDSAKAIKLANTYGAFANAADGVKQITTLENELIKVSISNKGGRIVGVELKKFKTHDSLPLMLCNEDSSKFSLSFSAQGKNFTTDSLFFKPIGNSFTVKGNESNKLSMRLEAGNGKYIEFEYQLKGNSYMMDMNINTVGMQDIILGNSNYMSLNWNLDALKHEKSHKTEQNATTIYYKHWDDEVDYLTEAKDGKESFQTKIPRFYLT